MAPAQEKLKARFATRGGGEVRVTEKQDPDTSSLTYEWRCDCSQSWNYTVEPYARDAASEHAERCSAMPLN